MSQNAQKLFNYLQENESNPEVFGDFDVFQEQLKDPEKAEKLRNYLGNEEVFGDSSTFYNKVNAENVTQEQQLSSDSNISITTTDSSDQILQNELNTPDSSSAVLSQITNPDYEASQKVDSSDYGYFQINDKVWNDTAMSMFGKPVADLNNTENIALASHIEKKSPRSWNNWVAFNKGKHKDFDEITDEQIVDNYGVPVDVLDSINQSFDDPQTAKKVMLAESGGDSTAININYTPQEDGQETINQKTLQENNQLINSLQNFQPQFETTEPSTLKTLDIQNQANSQSMANIPVSTQAREITEFLMKGLTGQYSGMYDTSEFESSKDVVEFATNAISTFAEFGAMPVDMATSLASDPVGVVKGLLQTMPEEFLTYAQALNIIDVVNPLLSLTGSGYSQKELLENRKKAQKYIFDTGGVYAYFAATGLTAMGKKNVKIAKKNKELADIVELANNRTPKNKINVEQKKAAESLKKDPSLLEKAEKIVSEQLEIDFLEPKAVDDIIKKADDVVATAIDLDRDIPSPTPIKRQVSKIQKRIDNVKKRTSKENVKPKSNELKDDIVQKIKINKSSDLSKGKNIEPIKGESARRYKSKEKLDLYIEEKLGEYVGQNVIARYGATQKGDYLVKIFKKTKEQPLPATATKRPPPKIQKDTDVEVVSKMRDPRNLKRRIQNQDMLAEKYSSEISELNRNLNSQMDELAKLESQALESGVQSPRIALIQNSIDATTSLIKTSQDDLRIVMSSKDLIKRIGKNISSRTAKGAVGRNVGKSIKEKAKQRLKDEELIKDVQQLWSNGKTGYNMTKKGLVRYLKEIGTDNNIIKYVNANFKKISDEAFFDNAKKLSSEIAEELQQSPGQVKGSRVRKRPSEEMFANIRVEIMSGKKRDNKKLAMVNVFESLVNNVGELKTRKAKGTRSLKKIQENARTKETYARYIEAVHYKKDLKFDIRELSEIQTVGVDHLFSLVEEFTKTRNNAMRAPINEALLAVESLISEPGRALRNLREIQAMNIADWSKFQKLFPDRPDILEIIKRIVKNEEIDRSSWFKIAEYARNAKLATGSSVVRGVSGNTFSMLNAYAKLPFEYGYDFILSNSMNALHELTNGQWGNISKNQINRLEYGAMISGHLEGLKKAPRLMLDMFLENDNALRQSAFFRNEGFLYKDIKGKKGVVIRTPQRIQGMLDIMYRVPLTEAFFRRNSIRQAAREGYKKSSEILKRADEIIKSESLDGDLIDSAVKDGKYYVFQSELEGIGKMVNGWRGGNQWYNAVGQMLVPFFNTAGNLFRYTLEHTPASIFMRNFRKGFVEAITPPKSKSRKFLEKKLKTEATEEGSRNLAREIAKVTSGIATYQLLNKYIVKNNSDKITGDWSNMFPEERNMRTRLGQQEYSIELDDGTWFSYRGFEPISSYLTVIHSTLKTEENTKNMERREQISKQIENATFELTKSFLENPFLAGTGDLFKAINRPETAGEFLTRFTAGMVLPGIVRQYAGVIDPNRRTKLKFTDINENIDFYDVAKSKGYGLLPWFTTKNLNALDPFGNEIPYPDPLGGLVAMRYTHAINDPVYEEIQKVFFDRDRGFKPASPLFTNSELAKIKYTPKEHYSLIKMSGITLYETIKEAMTKQYWKDWEDKPALKAKIIGRMQDIINQHYRDEVFAPYLDPIKSDMIDAEVDNIISTKEQRQEFLRQKRSEFDALTLEELRRRGIEAQKKIAPSLQNPYFYLNQVESSQLSQ